MKISIKLTIIALTTLAAPMLQAMEHPKSLADAIMQDNVATIKWFIEEKKLDPFEKIKHQPGYDPYDLIDIRAYQDESLFEIVLMKIDSPNIFQYLLPTADNWLIESSLEYALVNGPTHAKNLLWDEAIKRELDTQKILNKALENAVIGVKPAAVQSLLTQGADRYACYRTNRQFPIDIANRELEKAEKQLAGAVAFSDAIVYLWQDNDQFKHREDRLDAIKRHRNNITNLNKIIHILRTDAPNLKTCAALNVLNQVREGKLTTEDFKRVPQDLMEVIAMLANFDREAYPKWRKITDELMPKKESKK